MFLALINNGDFIYREVIFASILAVVLQEVLSCAIRDVTPLIPTLADIGSSSFSGAFPFSPMEIPYGKLNFNVIESIVKPKYVDFNILNNLTQGLPWQDLQHACYPPNLNLINYSWEYLASLKLGLAILGSYMYALSVIDGWISYCNYCISRLRDSHDYYYDIYFDIIKPYWDKDSDFIPTSAIYCLERLRDIEDEIRALEQVNKRNRLWRDLFINNRICSVNHLGIINRGY